MFYELHRMRLGYRNWEILGCTIEDRGEHESVFKCLRCCILEEAVDVVFVPPEDRIRDSADYPLID